MTSWLSAQLLRGLGRVIGVNETLGLEAIKRQSDALSQLTVASLRLEGHHNVLEVGFGDGIGIEETCKDLTSGLVCGIDIDNEVVLKTSKRLASPISRGIVHLSKQSVEKTSFDNEMFDRIFHVNCYYYWPSQLEGAKEMFRVLKPGGIMLTAAPFHAILHDDAMRDSSIGNLMLENVDVTKYQETLRDVGFQQVTFEKTCVKAIEIIFAKKPPAQ